MVKLKTAGVRTSTPVFLVLVMSSWACRQSARRIRPVGASMSGAPGAGGRLWRARCCSPVAAREWQLQGRL